MNPRYKASALFASSQFIAGRVVVTVLIAIAAYLVGCRQWPLFWVALMATSVLGQLCVRQGKYSAARFSNKSVSIIRTSLSFFDTLMYAAASAAMSQAHMGVAAPFAITIILLTMLYVLLHYYTQPTLVLMLHAPCFVGLVYCLAGPLFDRALIIDPQALYLPVAGAALTVYFFSEARRHLAKARNALMQSRADAIARAIEAQAANQAKSEFLAIIGHEIRTPLNGVLGIAQVMGVDELSDLQRERLLIIRDSGEALLAILNDVLDISKIEAGKLELEDVEFSLQDIAKGVHAAFKGSANAKDLEFHVAISEAPDGLYRGDPARLRQVVYNLVSNAVKFTQKGEVRVAFAYDDGRLVISVRDTGIGIPKARQAALFEKFVQADASMSRKYGGTGLGLAILYEVVQCMGGAISVQSAEGEGSAFELSIPLEKVAERAPDGSMPPVSHGGSSAEPSLRVLVAEDNVTNQTVVKLMLNQVGIQPIVVENGQAALEAWSSQAWDVILMDIQMPILDGIAATLAIRQAEQASGRTRTPIIALTANAMTHQKAEYLAAGMDGLIPKPINATEMFSILEANLAPLTSVQAEAA